MIKLRELSSHHRKTFDDIMTEPPKSGIKWDEVVALIEDGIAPFREAEEQKRLTLRVPMHIDFHLTLTAKLHSVSKNQLIVEILERECRR